MGKIIARRVAELSNTTNNRQFKILEIFLRSQSSYSRILTWDPVAIIVIDLLFNKSDDEFNKFNLV